MKNINKDFPETWEGKTNDYDLGNKESGWKIENENSSASFNSGEGELEFKSANFTYRDEMGNEITREQFYELKVEKLEKAVVSLEGEISLLIQLLSQKVDAAGVISAINISPEGVRIKGDKIEINGETLIDDKTLESKGLSTLEIGKIEDLPDDVLEKFNTGKDAKG